MILKDKEFTIFQKIVFDEIGISLNKSKRSLIQNRLYPRLLFYKIESYSKYLDILKNNHEEVNELINLITTNETSFFREKQHFDFLKNLVLKSKNKSSFRVWSAASSVGAEAYSIAMILADTLPFNQWSIEASDINTEVVLKAKTALYCETWLDKIPKDFRLKYCLKGKARYEGKFIIDRKLLNNVNFNVLNLTENILYKEKFDVVFLRNILIYFNKETKEFVLNNVIQNLKIGAYLIISVTESLEELRIKKLKKISGSIYERIG